jgi:hypothetical protein
VVAAEAARGGSGAGVGSACALPIDTSAHSAGAAANLTIRAATLEGRIRQA